MLGHPDNYKMADPLVTPPHIVPEWYFLPFYAILRCIPDKVGRRFSISGRHISLFALPILALPLSRSMVFRPFSRYAFWFFVADAIALGWLGSQSVDYPFLLLARLATAGFFFYFLVLAPSIISVENLFYKARSKPKPPKIAKARKKRSALTKIATKILRPKKIAEPLMHIEISKPKKRSRLSRKRFLLGFGIVE